jgi:hypothetical protein
VKGKRNFSTYGGCSSLASGITNVNSSSSNNNNNNDK